MSQTESVQTEVRTRHKSFSYRNRLEWSGDRNGILSAQERPEIAVSSPPEFKGEAGLWTPEDLFVGAVNVCMMLTFLAFAEKAQLPVLSYTSEAGGLLEFVGGRYLFSKIVLRPQILIGNMSQLEEARNVLNAAHKHCFVSNSIHSSVLIEPELSAP